MPGLGGFIHDQRIPGVQQQPQPVNLAVIEES